MKRSRGGEPGAFGAWLDLDVLCYDESRLPGYDPGGLRWSSKLALPHAAKWHREGSIAFGRWGRGEAARFADCPTS